MLKLVSLSYFFYFSHLFLKKKICQCLTGAVVHNIVPSHGCHSCTRRIIWKYELVSKSMWGVMVKDELRLEHTQRSVIKMIRVTGSLGNKCRFKGPQLYNIARWRLCSPVVVVHKLQEGGKKMYVNEQCWHKKKVWTSKDCVSAKNLSKVFTCHSRSSRRGKMWPVPLIWKVMQLPETVGDGMVGKHQHLCIWEWLNSFPLHDVSW